MSHNLSNHAITNPVVEPSSSMDFASILNSLRLSQDFESLVDVKQVVTEVSIGKPNRQTFFRVHPEWQAAFPILEFKTGMKSEFYIVTSSAASEIEDEVRPRLLVPVITRDGQLYIWPLRFSNVGQPLDSAATSSLAAMRLAKEQWVKLIWQGNLFVTFAARKKLPEPEWPELSFNKMLELAFEDRVIQTPDHPVIKTLLGEA